MELKAYWEIVYRRWWVVVGTLALALAVSLAGIMLIPQAVSYTASLSLAVRPLPEEKTGSYYSYDEYYAYLSSEYLNDDVIKLVQSSLFMQDVQNRLKGKLAVPPGGSIKGEKAHRVLTISVTSGTAEGALAIAQAATEALSPDTPSGRDYFRQLTARNVSVTVVDPPSVVAGPGTRAKLDLALRGLLGLLAGVALAFLLDYLDDTLRGAADAEQLLGIPVLGEIPSGGRSRRPERAPGRLPQRA